MSKTYRPEPKTKAKNDIQWTRNGKPFKNIHKQSTRCDRKQAKREMQQWVR